MNDAAAIGTPWGRASLAATVFALDPLSSGLWVRAGAGPARDALLERLGAELAPRQIVRIPPEIADDRLIGGLDIAATLHAGELRAQTGVLAGADGGVVVVTMAERMRGGVAARLNVALDRGEIQVQRDGLSLSQPARIGVVALDEGEADEAPPAALAERLSYRVDLAGVGWRDIEPPIFSAEDLQRARALLPRVETSAATIPTLTAVAAALGVDSLRAILFGLKAARALAALRGAREVEEEDIELAAALVLAPRATRRPAAPEAAQDRKQEPESGEAEGRQDEAAGALEERVLEATSAMIPPGLLERLASAPIRTAKAGTDGKSGSESRSKTRGRPIEAQPGSLAQGRLALVATLRAAAPWRRVRDPQRRDPRLVIVKPEDFRIARHRQRRGATTIFVVDASGSLAAHRLAEVKGAIELLLADCYVRRDEVALIAFRDKSGEIVLPPTRAIARARRALGDLAGGGGSPVAAGLDAALALADAVRRKGQTPLVVLMSDGRANVGRNGAGGRARAMDDALDAARRLRAERIATLAIDAAAPSAREDAPARKLAEAMGADYVKLPLADAARVHAAVQQARAS